MNSNYNSIELADNSNNNNIDFSGLKTVIKVIGIGNGGCNAVNRMIEEGLDGVEFIAMNTDAQALSRSNAQNRMVLGSRTTGGQGAGTDPEKGAEAAREDIAKIEEIVSNTDLVFIASSFGGGTGTGASPIVAEAAKKAGALTIGVITKPFVDEGKFKMKRAEAGIEKMLNVVDSLIIIPNENLYSMVDLDDYTYEEALAVVDDILRQGVQGISDIITQSGTMNVDFADVKTMISISNGRAHLGIGVGKGDDRLHKAIKNAFENPLLDVASIKNANGILANIVCPKDFTMKEYREASRIINSYASDNANIKIGVCRRDEINDEIAVTIVATGFDSNKADENTNNSLEKIEKKEDNTALVEEVKVVKEEVKPVVKQEPQTTHFNNNFKNTINAMKTPINRFNNGNINQNIKNNVNRDSIFNNSAKELNLDNYMEVIEEDKIIEFSDSIIPNNYSVKDALGSGINNSSGLINPFEKNTSYNSVFTSNNNTPNRNISSNGGEQQVQNSNTATAVKMKTEIEEDTKQQEEVASKPKFELLSDEEMKLHQDMANKSMSFNNTDTSSYDAIDLDTPACLRRLIHAKNTK